MSGIFGYFDRPDQATPTFDPGRDALCPICLGVCGSERKLVTISLMKEGDSRSYFFRAHKSCWTEAPAIERERIEHSLIDAPEGSAST